MEWVYLEHLWGNGLDGVNKSCISIKRILKGPNMVLGALKRGFVGLCLLLENPKNMLSFWRKLSKETVALMLKGLTLI